MLNTSTSLAARIVAISLLSVLFLISAEASASQHVRGHMKQNGTYVAPHNRTSANHTQRDNWSSKGNANPYTGKSGRKNPKK